MQELDKACSIEVAGPLAEQALAAFDQQLRVWDIVMPAVKPLALDFGLGDFYRVGLIEYWIANEVGAGYPAYFTSGLPLVKYALWLQRVVAKVSAWRILRLAQDYPSTRRKNNPEQALNEGEGRVEARWANISQRFVKYSGYCGKFLFLFDRQTCPRHHHREKLETFFIVKGAVEMDYDGKVWQMKPGDVLRVECGKPHQFRGVGPALILEVSRPCIVADNYFADPNIPIGGNYKSAANE